MFALHSWSFETFKVRLAHFRMHSNDSWWKLCIERICLMANNLFENFALNRFWSRKSSNWHIDSKSEKTLQLWTEIHRQINDFAIQNYRICSETESRWIKLICLAVLSWDFFPSQGSDFFLFFSPCSIDFTKSIWLAKCKVQVRYRVLRSDHEDNGLMMIVVGHTICRDLTTSTTSTTTTSMMIMTMKVVETWIYEKWQ